MKESKFLQLVFIIVVMFTGIGLIRGFHGDGNAYFIYAGVDNDLDHDLDEIRLKAYVFDLYDYDASRVFSVEENNRRGSFMNVDKNGLEPDYYPVRVHAYGDDVWDIRHTWVWIE